MECLDLALEGLPDGDVILLDDSHLRLASIYKNTSQLTTLKWVLV